MRRCTLLSSNSRSQPPQQPLEERARHFRAAIGWSSPLLESSLCIITVVRMVQCAYTTLFLSVIDGDDPVGSLVFTIHPVDYCSEFGEWRECGQ